MNSRRCLKQDAFSSYSQNSHQIPFKKMAPVLMLIIFAVALSLAAPHDREEHFFRQPDGSLVPVIVSGDEYFQDVESPDGYTLIRDSQTEWICYAQLSENGTAYLSTGVRYYVKQGLSKSAAPPALKKHLRISSETIRALRDQSFTQLHGTNHLLPDPLSTPGLKKTHASSSDTVYGVTILIDFPDQKSAIPRDTIVKFLNQTGYRVNGNNGSVKDYFESISAGKLVYLQKVTNFVTAKNKKSYYDRTDGSGYAGSNELVTEILTTLRNQGTFDFSQATISNRRVRAVNILYAGSPSAGWAQGLWPHSGTTNFAITSSISIRSHMFASIGTRLTIGTFCHENGHMLCNWPDLYAYDGHSNGAARYDIMGSSGGTNPVPPNPFFRELMGWMEIKDISSDAYGKLFKVPANTNVAFRYSGSNHGSTQEAYYIEARRRTGRSATLPDSGLIIWHVNKAGDNTKEGKNDRVMPEQADGRYDLEKKVNTGDVNDLFRSPASQIFNDNSSPSAKWHNGATSGIQIAQVSAVKDTMTFLFGGSSSDLPTAKVHNYDAKVLFDPAKNQIHFTVPSGSSNDPTWVSIGLWNINGQLVQTLVNGYRHSGEHYSVPVVRGQDGVVPVVAGVYVCKVVIGRDRHIFPMRLVE